jgi:hypothetical protein
VWLPDDGITATILPFIERYSKVDARDHGVNVDVALPARVMAREMTRERWRVMPGPIAESVYSRYSSGSSPGYAYKRPMQAVDAVARIIEQATGPTYTYLYMPQVDAAQHTHGVYSREAQEALQQVREMLCTLTEQLGEKARLVVTADHGLIDLQPEQQTELPDGDPLLELLSVPPTCEPRVPSFHVRAGAEEAFEDMFRERLGDDFALLTLQEADDLRLFGPGPMTQRTRRRLGDYLAVSTGPREVRYRPDSDMIGFHGGAHRDEMRVPLIIA